MGACRRAASNFDDDSCMVNKIRAALSDKYNTINIVDWNDSRKGKEEVLSVIDEAIRGCC